MTKKDVNSYPEIEGFIDEGTKNRTVAATNMNATSSRAHTIGFDLTYCMNCKLYTVYNVLNNTIQSDVILSSHT